MVSTAIVLDVRREKKDGTFPVKLRVTFQRRQKYYSVGKSLTEEDWSSTQQARPRGNAKELSIYFSEVEAKARKIIDSLDKFSFSAFKEQFFQKKVQKYDFYSFLDAKIDYLKKIGSYSTSDGYRGTKNYIVLMPRSKNLKLTDVTISWLERFESLLLIDHTLSISTYSIYVRNIRAILNEAKSKGLISEKDYPFGRYKYQIPTRGTGKKKALNLEQLKSLRDYDAKPMSQEHWAKDMFLFSYLANGANPMDILKLKYEDVDFKEDRIYFLRQKTKTTKRKNIKEVEVYLNGRIKEIIETWGKPKTPKSYIFSVVKKGMNEKEQRQAVKNQTRFVNIYLKRIAEKLEYNPITWGMARHTFATTIKNKGVPVSKISEMMGHSSTKITQNYLGSIETDDLRDISNKLLDL